jgi:hypothetical protein
MAVAGAVCVGVEIVVSVGSMVVGGLVAAEVGATVALGVQPERRKQRLTIIVKMT